jgi:hypothetical protein
MNSNVQLELKQFLSFGIDEYISATGSSLLVK